MLRSRRTRRGSLDFELPEAKVVLDADGQCTDVISSRANPLVRKAYSLIEELMLLANEKVAELLISKGVQTIFRIHEKPDESKLELLKQAGRNHGRVVRDRERAKAQDVAKGAR